MSSIIKLEDPMIKWWANNKFEISKKRSMHSNCVRPLTNGKLAL